MRGVGWIGEVRRRRRTRLASSCFDRRSAPSSTDLITASSNANSRLGQPDTYQAADTGDDSIEISTPDQPDGRGLRLTRSPLHSRQEKEPLLGAIAPSRAIVFASPIEAARGQTAFVDDAYSAAATRGREHDVGASLSTRRSGELADLARVRYSRAVRLRSLLPSWRFFDRAVASPELFVRIADGPWQPLPVPVRQFWSWAFAPAGNLALAYQSTVEQLVAQVDELDDSTDHDDPKITSLVGWMLVNEIAREAGASQWKIVRDGEDYLLGPA
jgi:hypothetical protein